MSASLAAVMLTPGKTAPVASITRPSMAPVVAPTVWAGASLVHNTRHAADETRILPARDTSSLTLSSDAGGVAGGRKTRPVPPNSTPNSQLPNPGSLGELELGLGIALSFSNLSVEAPTAIASVT